MSRPDPHPTRLAFPLRHLRLSARALAAFELLGVRSVGDFLALERARFVAQPNCGERTWSDATKRVTRFLEEAVAVPSLSEEALARPVADIVRNRRALRACRDLKIKTVGELVATPRDELLAAPGFGERTLLDVERELLGASPGEAWTEILPPCVLDLRLDALPADCRSRIPGAESRRLAELVADAPDAPTRVALRAGLNALFGDLLAARTLAFDAWLRSGRDRMPREVRAMFDRVVGVFRRPAGLEQAAAAQRLPVEDARRLLDIARHTLLVHEPAALDRWARELDDDLRAMGGVVTPTRLAAGSGLRAAALDLSDAAMPLRVVAFCRPDVAHAHGDFVARLDTASIDRLEAALRARVAGEDNAIRLADIRNDLPEVVMFPDQEELLLHLLRHRLHRSLRFHPRHGEIVLRPPRALGDRIESILENEGVPLRIDDLLFHYRDRHGAGRRRRLEDALRADSRFLQIGFETWSLRARHVDELELVRPEAERIREEIRTYGGRRGVLDLRDGPGSSSERTAHLLVDHLRREPCLRDLGRGEFCARRTEGSPLVSDIVRALRRAMGEVPFARFLQNQPPGRRRLVARLLRVNRLFLSPSRDRVDLAENYPFTGERLRILLQETRTRIDTSGYASLASIHEAVDRAGLGGEFLTEHLLLDILRRHGDFEILPGPIVADARLGLGNWIQKTTRQILRAHREGLTPEQLLAERPELAEFAAALPELLELDPLVQSDDGLHYHLV